MWIDRKKAVVQFRTPDGIVASITGNRDARRGAHSHRDGGSFRISRNGVDWIAKAPAGKGRWRENVIDLEGCNGWHGGAITHFSATRAAFCLDPVCLQSPVDGDRWDDAKDIGTSWRRSLEIIEGGVELKDILSISGVWRAHAMVDEVEVLSDGFRLRKGEEELKIVLGEVPLHAEQQEGQPKGADGVLHDPISWWVLEAEVRGAVCARFLFSDVTEAEEAMERRLQPGDDVQAAIDEVCARGGVRWP